ncbi:MAG: anion transporter [Desulfobacteraceae bacterium]|jgi:Na+/H+ antiporter NhaD/arsenite permease-like protein|nr:MAG: anion transporter [Desulfobacteraceae bacterium]
MISVAAAIFILTYAGVAVGRIPGLMLDRTGIALLGAIAMVVFGVISVEQAADAVDVSTILLLYALMIVSAQLRLGGFYTWAVLKSTAFLDYPRTFLFSVMMLSAALSAILANDIVCLAFTPVLAVTLLTARVNPAPFLIGLAMASNIGSAATIIGNPQNMLIGQMGRLDFGQFMAWCGPPSMAALLAAYLLICRLYRGRFAVSLLPGRMPPKNGVWPEFNAWQSGKGLMAAAALMVLFFSPVPREYAAIGVAGVLLCSRKLRSRSMLEFIDWHLITLFCALFVIIQGIVAYDIPAAVIAHLGRYGIDPGNLFILTGVSAVMSNMVSNVPAVILLIQFLNPADPAAWHVLAVSSTFAGNLIVIGSIANLIVIEQARNFGIEIGFKEHARAGIPVTLISIAILCGWILLTS